MSFLFCCFLDSDNDVVVYVGLYINKTCLRVIVLQSSYRELRLAVMQLIIYLLCWLPFFWLEPKILNEFFFFFFFLDSHNDIVVCVGLYINRNLFVCNILQPIYRTHLAVMQLCLPLFFWLVAFFFGFNQKF